ncbi:MAG: DoxX family protein [Cyanobacteria bacterium P01_F01_bin.42]
MTTFNNAKSNRTTEIALFILRLIIISIFLYHGFPKALYWGFAAEKFVGFGLPGFLGPITGIAEVVASGFLIVGYQNRWVNYALMFIIAGAIVTVQLPKAIDVLEYTAGLERDLLILIGCWVSAVLGPGILSLDNSKS